MLRCFIVLLVCFCCTTAVAQDAESTEKPRKQGFSPKSKTSIGIHAGLTGFGGSLNYAVGNRFYMAVTGSYLNLNQSFSTELEGQMLTADLRANMMSFDLRGYLFPFKRFPLFLTGGVAHLVETEFYGLGNLGSSVQIGEAVFITPEQVGNVGASIRYNNLAPFAGFGFGRPIAGKGRLSFLFQMGVYLFGEPEADILATGLLVETMEQRGQFQENMKGYQYFPMLNLSLNFRI